MSTTTCDFIISRQTYNQVGEVCELFGINSSVIYNMAILHGIKNVLYYNYCPVTSERQISKNIYVELDENISARFKECLNKVNRQKNIMHGGTENFKVTENQLFQSFVELELEYFYNYKELYLSEQNTDCINNTSKRFYNTTEIPIKIPTALKQELQDMSNTAQMNQKDVIKYWATTSMIKEIEYLDTRLLKSVIGILQLMEELKLEGGKMVILLSHILKYKLQKKSIIEEAREFE